MTPYIPEACTIKLHAFDSYGKGENFRSAASQTGFSVIHKVLWYNPLLLLNGTYYASC